MPFCPECGKAVVAGQKFCANCGQGLSAANIPQVPEPPATGSVPVPTVQQPVREMEAAPSPVQETPGPAAQSSVMPQAGVDDGFGTPGPLVTVGNPPVAARKKSGLGGLLIGLAVALLLIYLGVLLLSPSTGLVGLIMICTGFIVIVLSIRHARKVRSRSRIGSGMEQLSQEEQEKKKKEEEHLARMKKNPSLAQQYSKQMQQEAHQRHLDRMQQNATNASRKSFQDFMDRNRKF
jgi:zinc-ribbon domain